MKYSLEVQIPGGKVFLEVESQKQVFDELSFWQSLPSTCPIDGTPIRVNTRTATTKKNVDVTYYELVSTGFPVWRGLIGQNMVGGTLYYPGTWVHYDGENETTVYQAGRITNQAYIDRVTGKGSGKAGQNGAQGAGQNGVQNGAQGAGQNGAQGAGQNGAQGAGQNGAQNGAQGAGKRENEKVLEEQIKKLFSGIADNAVLMATPWLIKRFTTHYTPDNVRSAISALSNEECKLVAESCEKYPAKLADDFKAWRKAQEEQARAQRKAKEEQEKSSQLADIPF